MFITVRALVTLLFIAVTYPGATAFGAEPLTEHTYKLADDGERPVATLADAGFLVGSWEGTGFGGRIEEVWNPPSAGSMVGMFKFFVEDKVVFYELLLMTVEEGTLSLKVKHFNADFSAWEEKEDYIDFRLVKIEDDALHFGGLSFYKRGDDAVDGYIVMRNAEGIREEPLAYTRVRKLNGGP